MSLFVFLVIFMLYDINVFHLIRCGFSPQATGGMRLWRHSSAGLPEPSNQRASISLHGTGVVSELRRRIRTTRSHWKQARVIRGVHMGRGAHVGRGMHSCLRACRPQQTRSLERTKKHNKPTAWPLTPGSVCGHFLWMWPGLVEHAVFLLFSRLLLGFRHHNFPYTSLLNMGF